MAWGMLAVALGTTVAQHLYSQNRARKAEGQMHSAEMEARRERKRLKRKKIMDRYNSSLAQQSLAGGGTTRVRRRI